MAKKIPKELIPKLPKGCAPFKEEDLLWKTLRLQVDEIHFYGDDAFGDNVDSMIERLKRVKIDLAKKRKISVSQVPELETDFDGPEYEGPDRIEFYEKRLETRNEIRARIGKIHQGKLAALAKKEKKSLLDTVSGADKVK